MHDFQQQLSLIGVSVHFLGRRGLSEFANRFVLSEHKTSWIATCEEQPVIKRAREQEGKRAREQESISTSPPVLFFQKPQGGAESRSRNRSRMAVGWAPDAVGIADRISIAWYWRIGCAAEQVV